ncbi:unnamed protein product [Ectocarpus sp. 12 AP-2014]
MKSYRSKEEATPPQLKEAATEVELYQCVVQSSRAYGQILYQIANNLIAATCENLCDAEFDRGSDSVFRSDHVFQPQEVLDAIETCSERVSGVSFEPLQEAVDRPSFRGGFGGLLINLGLIFSKAVQGDLHAALERMSLCVEVCERYPGFCRRTVGFHPAHMVLVSLAAIVARELKQCMTGCGGPTICFALLARGPYPLWRSGTEWMPSAMIRFAGRWISLIANWRLPRHHPLIASTPAWKRRARTMTRVRPLSEEAGRP